MIRKYFDECNNFLESFNEETGHYFRSGILDENGLNTEFDPFQRDFPNLLDIGIMGHCVAGTSGQCLQGKVECYQDGFNISKSNMRYQDFTRIIDESKELVFQVALGGRGDPNHHWDFEKILGYARMNGIIPNYTTSGFGLHEREARITKEFCGAVAVSWQRQDYTSRTIDMFLGMNMKTNIHYVLSNRTIDEAIGLLKNNGFPEKINAVVFLLHKPVGLGTKENILSCNDDRVKIFFDLIDNWKGQCKVGFDSCTVPGILNFTKNISRESLDTCEGGRFSMYISSDMKALPCSFDQDMRWSYDISSDSIERAWRSPQFDAFRKILKDSCPSCSDRLECMGGCPIKPNVVLCNREERHV